MGASSPSSSGSTAGSTTPFTSDVERHDVDSRRATVVPPPLPLYEVLSRTRASTRRRKMEEKPRTDVNESEKAKRRTERDQSDVISRNDSCHPIGGPNADEKFFLFPFLLFFFPFSVLKRDRRQELGHFGRVQLIVN